MCMFWPHSTWLWFSVVWVSPEPGPFQANSLGDSDVHQSWRRIGVRELREGQTAVRVLCPFPGRDSSWPGEAACIGSDALPLSRCCFLASLAWQLAAWGPQLRHVGTFFLDQEVSAWGCHPGSELSPLISRSSNWSGHGAIPLDQGSVILGLFTPVIDFPLGGEEDGGKLHLQTLIIFSWLLIVEVHVSLGADWGVGCGWRWWRHPCPQVAGPGELLLCISAAGELKEAGGRGGSNGEGGGDEVVEIWSAHICHYVWVSARMVPQISLHLS